MNSADVLFDKIEKLSIDELHTVAEKIFNLLQQVENSPQSSSVLSNVQKCRKCESTQIKKFGKDKNGKQRYRCNSCGCTFTETSFSVVSHSHCSFEVWKKYINCLLKGDSLETCSKECSISVRTAFLWRHKILAILQKDQDTRVMNGIVETDDMFISVSYKGNHKNSKKFSMPRAAYERGTDNRGPIGEKACVMCAVERKGHAYGEVLGVGLANDTMLEHAFKNRLLEDTVVVTDKARNFKRYFDTSNIELVQTSARAIANNHNSPPEVKGVYHIQNVNNMHNRFRRFMRNYNGVATKYLNHYVNLYIWIENHKKINNINLSEELCSSISNHGLYIASADVLNLPALPSVA